MCAPDTDTMYDLNNACDVCVETSEIDRRASCENANAPSAAKVTTQYHVLNIGSNYNSHNRRKTRRVYTSDKGK
jgi:hypothetical protein